MNFLKLNALHPLLFSLSSQPKQLLTMISRRNIRVKVMQTLYQLSTQEEGLKPGDAQKLLQKHFDQSRDLLQYFIYFIAEVAAYAEKDAFQRSSKHLPSEA